MLKNELSKIYVELISNKLKIQVKSFLFNSKLLKK